MFYREQAQRHRELCVSFYFFSGLILITEMNLNYLRRENLHKGIYYYFKMEFARTTCRLKTETLIPISQCFVDLFHGANGEDMWEMYETGEFKLFIFREYELTEKFPSFYLAETYEDAVDLWNRVLFAHHDIMQIRYEHQSEILLSKTL